MRKLIVLLIALVACTTMYAQQELPAYKVAITRFQTTYGGGSIDSLYRIFSMEKRENSTISETKQWLSGLRAKYGDINSVNFLKQDSAYASYKIKFEKATRVLTMSLDREDKILGLVFRPFDPEEFPDADAEDSDREPTGKD